MYSVQLKNTKEIYDFCMLNGITDINKFVQECFKQGFDIQRYGLLGETPNEGEKDLIKEVIVEKRIEIPVEVIKEVEKIIEVIKEVPVEKVVEVIKEVPVDRVIEKVVEVTKEIPVEKVVIKEVVKEVPIDRVVEKEIYITDDKQVKELGESLSKKNEELDELRQKFSTKEDEIITLQREFSTKTTEMENIFQNKMSKKDEELDELRRTLDIELDKPPVEIIKEVVVEKQSDDKNVKKLQETLVKLRQNILDKDSIILNLEDKISELTRLQDEKKALYLRGSNLDDKLYK